MLHLHLPEQQRPEQHLPVQQLPVQHLQEQHQPEQQLPVQHLPEESRDMNNVVPPGLSLTPENTCLIDWCSVIIDWCSVISELVKQEGITNILRTLNEGTVVPTPASSLQEKMKFDQAVSFIQNFRRIGGLDGLRACLPCLHQVFGRLEVELQTVHKVFGNPLRGEDSGLLNAAVPVPDVLPVPNVGPVSDDLPVADVGAVSDVMPEDLPVSDVMPDVGSVAVPDVLPVPGPVLDALPKNDITRAAAMPGPAVSAEPVELATFTGKQIEEILRCVVATMAKKTTIVTKKVATLIMSLYSSHQSEKGISGDSIRVSDLRILWALRNVATEDTMPVDQVKMALEVYRWLYSDGNLKCFQGVLTVADVAGVVDFMMLDGTKSVSKEHAKKIDNAWQRFSTHSVQGPNQSDSLTGAQVRQILKVLDLRCYSKMHMNPCEAREVVRDVRYLNYMDDGYDRLPVLVSDDPEISVRALHDLQSLRFHDSEQAICCSAIKKGLVAYRRLMDMREYPAPYPKHVQDSSIMPDVTAQDLKTVWDFGRLGPDWTISLVGARAVDDVWRNLVWSEHSESPSARSTTSRDASDKATASGAASAGSAGAASAGAASSRAASAGAAAAGTTIVS